MKQQAHRMYFSDRELFEMTGIARQTWTNWRHRGKGPEYVKLDRKVLYSLEAIEKFFNDHKVKTQDE